jgi:hypothetical protein
MRSTVARGSGVGAVAFGWTSYGTASPSRSLLHALLGERPVATDDLFDGGRV